MNPPDRVSRYYSVEYGWTSCSDVEVQFDSKVEWYVGESDQCGVYVSLSEGLLAEVYAKVTVWAFGVGSVYYAADPGSLVALVGMFMPGASWMKDKHLTVIEVAE